MRIAFFLVLASALLAAPLKNVVRPEPNARFRGLIAGVSRVIITSAGLHPADLKNQKLILDLDVPESAVRFAALFKFSGEFTAASPTVWDGKEVLMISNCFCTGSHMLSFIRDGQEVLAMSLHHWTHVRPVRGWKSQDINLTKESSESVRAFLTTIPKASNPANQAPEPTTTAVTPRAPSPISEMKLPTPIPNAARSAPAVVVAHL